MRNRACKRVKIRNWRRAREEKEHGKGEVRRGVGGEVGSVNNKETRERRKDKREVRNCNIDDLFQRSGSNALFIFHIASVSLPCLSFPTTGCLYAQDDGEVIGSFKHSRLGTKDKQAQTKLLALQSKHKKPQHDIETKERRTQCCPSGGRTHTHNGQHGPERATPARLLRLLALRLGTPVSY